MDHLKSPSLLEHFISVLALPVMVLLVVPYLILETASSQPLLDFLHQFRYWLILIGAICLILGLVLFFSSNTLFHTKGKGTLAPWNPPKKIVIYGPYRYVRNPMLAGVNFILLAEAFLIPSGNILLWQLFFFILNHLYFIYKEEPDLEKRFGNDYLEYKKQVPRWLPRWKAWKENKEQIREDFDDHVDL